MLSRCSNEFSNLFDVSSNTIITYVTGPDRHRNNHQRGWYLVRFKHDIVHNCTIYEFSNVPVSCDLSPSDFSEVPILRPYHNNLFKLYMGVIDISDLKACDKWALPSKKECSSDHPEFIERAKVVTELFINRIKATSSTKARVNTDIHTQMDTQENWFFWMCSCYNLVDSFWSMINCITDTCSAQIASVHCEFISILCDQLHTTTNYKLRVKRLLAVLKQSTELMSYLEDVDMDKSSECISNELYLREWLCDDFSMYIWLTTCVFMKNVHPTWHYKLDSHTLDIKLNWLGHCQMYSKISDHPTFVALFRSLTETVDTYYGFLNNYDAFLKANPDLDSIQTQIMGPMSDNLLIFDRVDMCKMCCRDSKINNLDTCNSCFGTCNFDDQLVYALRLIKKFDIDYPR
jgi:hypothetical protein